MSIRHAYVCGLAFASALAVAGLAPAQPVGPGPVGPGPIGPGPVGPGPIGPGPVGPGPIGVGPIGPGPMGLPPMPMAMTIGPMSLDLPPMVMAWSDQDRPDRQDREKEAEQRERERESRVYEQGKDDLDEGRYDRAIARLGDAASMKGAHADKALYWKAYAQNKAGQRVEALATLAALTKDYPKTGYLQQVKALDQEVRQSSGQPARPGDQSDEDLKLYAIAALQNSDPEQAVPLLAKVLQGTASPRVKSKALFVLAQSDSPRARDLLKKIAIGTSTPDLQNRAIDYLGTQGGAESRAVLGE